MKYSQYLKRLAKIHGKFFLKKCDFFYTLQPIYLFSRVFGSMPFSLNRNLKGEIQGARISVFDFSWFAISMSFYLSMLYIYLQDVQLPRDSNESYILILGDKIRQIVGLIVAVFIICMDMLNRYRIVEIFHKFMSFDVEVNIIILNKGIKRTNVCLSIRWHFN